MKKKIVLTIQTTTKNHYYWYDETEEEPGEYLRKTLPKFKKNVFIGVKKEDGKETFLATDLIENVDWGKTIRKDFQ